MQGNKPYNYVANISFYRFVIYIKVSSLLAKPAK